MKLSLSLKIALCLLLNLAVLGLVGLAFLLAWGGLGWSSLVTGPAGRRVQSIGDLIAGEVAAATTQDQPGVLARFGAAYGVEVAVFDRAGEPLAGNTAAVPDEVLARFKRTGPFAGPSAPPLGFHDGERHRLEPSKGDRPPMAPAEPAPGLHDPRFNPEAPQPRWSGPPQPRGPRNGPPSQRFLLRAGAPPAFWIGLRTNLPPPSSPAAFAAPTPSTLLIRVGSFWGLLRLLELQSWILGAIAVLGVSILFWLPLVRGITRALGQLTAATEDLAEGRFETRVPAKRGDELGRLGESVNRMAARLDTLVTGQRRFLGDIAHELCSPLARLQMAIGILEERAEPALRASVADVREEVQQMAELVNDLLAFTRAGLGSRMVKTGPLVLAPLVAHILAREAGSARIVTSIPVDLQVQAEASLLSRALANLVRNAVRYAGADGPITVSAHSGPDGVHITVVDEGPGVAPESLASLGEPFFRPEAARTREAGGVGLGLAIVKSAVLACRGTVAFSNRAPRGFAVAIRLPAVPPAAA